MNSELKGNVSLGLKWRDEPDFSDWLAENLDVLNEQVKLVWDIDTASVQREVNEWVGKVRVDLLCDATKPGSEKPFKVVIENQLKEADRDHFARLMLYITAFDAKGAIWIASEVNYEWAAVVHWLNENSEIDVYLFTVELLANSTVDITVPVLTPIVGPGIAAPERGTLTDNRKIGDWWRRVLPKVDEKCRGHDFWQGFTATSDIQQREHAVPHPNSQVSEYIKWFIQVVGNLSLVGIYIPASALGESSYYSDQILIQKEKIENKFGEPLFEGKGEYCIIYLNLKSPHDGRDTNFDARVDALADIVERLVDATKDVIASIEPYQLPSSDGVIL